MCNQSATLIDNISSTEIDKKYEAGILLSSLSDHFPVYLVRDLSNQIQEQNNSRIKNRKINAITMLTFENLVKNISWEDVLTENDPKVAFQKFYEKIENLTDIAFPEVNKIVHKKDKISFPWFTNGLKISNINKMKLASLKLRKPKNENILKYKNYLSVYNKVIRKA